VKSSEEIELTLQELYSKDLCALNKNGILLLAYNSPLFQLTIKRNLAVILHACIAEGK
jgi:hypothetical protein